MTNEEKKARVKAIGDQIRELRAEQERLSGEVAQSQSRFTIGGTIQWKSGGQAKRKGIVRRIQRGSMWEVLTVQSLLKSGELGKITEVRPYHEPEKVE